MTTTSQHADGTLQPMAYTETEVRNAVRQFLADLPVSSFGRSYAIRDSEESMEAAVVWFSERIYAVLAYLPVPDDILDRMHVADLIAAAKIVVAHGPSSITGELEKAVGAMATSLEAVA